MHRSERGEKKKRKTYCKSDEKHKEQQKDKHEDVKKGLQNCRMWGRKVRKSRQSFPRMCLSLYDYQAKASRYRKGLTYLKHRATTNQNQTLHSQKLKRKVLKHKTNGNHPTKKRKKENIILLNIFAGA